MVEKGIKGGVCHSICRYAEANNRYMKNMIHFFIVIKKELSYRQYWDVNNLYGHAMSHNLPLNNFEWIKGTSQYNEDFLKTIMKKVMKDILSKLMFNILKSYMDFAMIYNLYMKE